MPGKFEGNESEEVAEILYDATLNGMVDEEIGDVQEYGLWTAIFRGVKVENGELLDAEKGGYIVEEDERGFFDYMYFDQNNELEEEWQRAVFNYEEAMEESEPEEEEEV